MKLALALVLCSSLAAAQDAPFLDTLPPPGRVAELDAGSILPFDATCLDKPQALRAAKIAEHDRTALERAKEGKVLLPTPAFIGIIVGVAVVVAAASAGIVKATEKK